MSLRNAHPGLVPGERPGQSCLDIKLYDRGALPLVGARPVPETAQYLKDRVAELAQIEGGLCPSGSSATRRHFVLRPARILPTWSRDRVCPLWDFCYCDVCRANFKALDWWIPWIWKTRPPIRVDARWDALSAVASECRD